MITFIFVLLAIVLYFFPSIIAAKRKRKNVEAIFLVNLFFGWSLIGWFVALIWAVKKD